MRHISAAESTCVLGPVGSIFRPQPWCRRGDIQIETHYAAPSLHATFARREHHPGVGPRSVTVRCVCCSLYCACCKCVTAAVARGRRTTYLLLLHARTGVLLRLGDDALGLCRLQGCSVLPSVHLILLKLRPHVRLPFVSVCDKPPAPPPACRTALSAMDLPPLAPLKANSDECSRLLNEHNNHGLCLRLPVPAVCTFLLPLPTSRPSHLSPHSSNQAAAPLGSRSHVPTAWRRRRRL